MVAITAAIVGAALATRSTEGKFMAKVQEPIRPAKLSLVKQPSHINQFVNRRHYFISRAVYPSYTLSALRESPLIQTSPAVLSILAIAKLGWCHTLGAAPYLTVLDLVQCRIIGGRPYKGKPNVAVDIFTRQAKRTVPADIDLERLQGDYACWVALFLSLLTDFAADRQTAQLILQSACQPTHFTPCKKSTSQIRLLLRHPDHLDREQTCRAQNTHCRCK